jgi:hypothetical protein
MPQAARVAQVQPLRVLLVAVMAVLVGLGQAHLHLVVEVARVATLEVVV